MDERQQELREEGSRGDEFVGENVEEQKQVSAQNPHVQHSEVLVEGLSWDWTFVSLQDSVEPLLFLAYPSYP